MRYAAVVVAVVVGLGAGVGLADKAAPPPPTLVETWVGTWTGKATWTECSLGGGSTLTMPIESLGSMLTSDGDVLMDGLGALQWSARGKELVVARDGLDVSLTPGKKGAIKLAMRTAAGCEVEATLKRATSGMPSCDAMRALATAKSTCDGLDEEARDDDLAEIEGAWKGWKKLKGKKKKARAKACTAALPALRTEISSCAPVGVTSTIAAGAGCQGLFDAMNALLSCAAVPAEMRAQVQEGIEQLKGMSSQLTDSICDSVLEGMRPQLAQLGCPI